MGKPTVLNHFEQPVGSDRTDNALVLGGTVKGANGSQSAAIADPAGGGTVDAEARTAINALIAALENAGIVAT